MRPQAAPNLERWRALPLLIGAKLVAVVIVVSAGFQAVSDDDYSRVVIAQQWAKAPRFDPTGTSWLPAPFWILGSAMLLFGRSLAVAKAIAIAQGVVSALLVYMAARWLIESSRATQPPAMKYAAIAGGLVAAVFPWSAQLGVATVPELPTAALSLVAIASLALTRGPTQAVAPASPNGHASPLTTLHDRRRLIAAALLVIATLSRYEAWPVAFVFSAYSILDAWRARGQRAVMPWVPAGVALLGPALWVAWNAHAHQNAFAFAARVAAYRKALGAADTGFVRAFFDYAWSALRCEPELMALALTTIVAGAFTPLRSMIAFEWCRYARPAIAIGVLLMALAFAATGDGAPTHHPERAILVIWLMAAVFVGENAIRIATAAIAPSTRLITAGAAGLAIVLAFFARPKIGNHEDFARRRDEVALGHAAASAIPAGDRVLLEVIDYGHLAFMAAFGRPEDVVLDRDIDPRRPLQPSSFEQPEQLTRRLESVQARHYAARVAVAAPLAGEPITQRGAWGLWRTK